MISTLLGEAETRHKSSPTIASKSWITLVKLVAKLIIDNTELKLALRNTQQQYLNHDLHLEAVEAKADRVLRQLSNITHDD